ncbi:MAG: Fur family transcriptional regulator [Cyanobacteria bacterium P01_H01_bin.74]
MHTFHSGSDFENPLLGKSESLNSDERKALSVLLKDKGFRLTPQRETILDIFYTLPEGEHISTEELHALLQKEGADISLATAYRTLKLLASLGVLRELDFAEDHKHYELARNPESPHHHIICLDCGSTEEFESEEITRFSEALAKERGLTIIDVQLKVFAHCHNHEKPAEKNTEHKKQ